VYVLCDNARYYKNKDLAAWLTGTRLVQFFLPTYSPHLNLIERLWKFLRQKIIDTQFYRTKARLGPPPFLFSTGSTSLGQHSRP